MNELKDLWGNPKYNALLKLIIWGIFFIIIYALIIMNSQRTINNNNEESKKNIYNQKLINLKYNTLKVKYTMLDYYVEGTVEKNIFIGTIEYTDGTMYKIKYDGKNISKISNIEGIDEEYILISINSKYLLPSYIMNLIEDKDPDKINGTSHIYNIDDIEYEIKSNQESIYEITITENNIISKLEYSVLN